MKWYFWSRWRLLFYVIRFHPLYDYGKHYVKADCLEFVVVFIYVSQHTSWPVCGGALQMMCIRE